MSYPDFIRGLGLSKSATERLIHGKLTSLEAPLRYLRIVEGHRMIGREPPDNLFEQAVSLIPSRKELLDERVAKLTVDEGLAAAFTLSAIEYNRREDSRRARSFAKKAAELVKTDVLTNRILRLTMPTKDPVPHYEVAQMLDPDNTVILNSLAVEYVERRQPQKAIKSIRRLLRHEPDKPEHYTLLGKAYLDTCDKNYIEKAFTALRKAIKLNGSHTMPRSLLAIAYARTGQPEEASKIYFGLGLAAKESRDFDSAVTAFEQAYRFLPDNPNVRNELAKAYVDNGAPERAIPLFKNLEALSEDNAFDYAILAQVFVENKQQKKAIGIYGELARAFPDSDHAQYWLAESHRIAGHNRKAIGLYKNLTAKLQGIKPKDRRHFDWFYLVMAADRLIKLGNREFSSVLQNYRLAALTSGFSITPYYNVGKVKI